MISQRCLVMKPTACLRKSSGLCIGSSYCLCSSPLQNRGCLQDSLQMVLQTAMLALKAYPCLAERRLRDRPSVITFRDHLTYRRIQHISWPPKSTDSMSFLSAPGMLINAPLGWRKGFMDPVYVHCRDMGGILGSMGAPGRRPLGHMSSSAYRCRVLRPDPAQQPPSL